MKLLGRTTGRGVTLSLFVCFLLLTGIFILTARASEENGTIDSLQAYAWSENAGWINFGSTEGNVVVTASGISGYAWGENIGWISLNCSNNDSCGTVDYKVANDGEGSLSGYAWGENVGWIDFNPDNGGVTIDSSGVFSGYAWGENIGWIVFNCATNNTCGTVDYKVVTDWRAQGSGSSGNNNGSSGSSTQTGGGGSDPVSDTNASPVLRFVSKLFSNVHKTLGIISTVRLNTDIEITVRPVDVDRLQSLTLIIGKRVYQLRPKNAGPNSFVYTTTIRFTDVGLKPYTLRADYGSTDRKSKGVFRVVDRDANAKVPDRLLFSVTVPASGPASIRLPSLQRPFESEATITAAPNDLAPFRRGSEDEYRGESEDSNTVDTSGLAVGDFFSSSIRFGSVITKTTVSFIGDVFTAVSQNFVSMGRAIASFFRLR